MMGTVMVRSVKVTLPFLSTNTTELVLWGEGEGRGRGRGRISALCHSSTIYSAMQQYLSIVPCSSTYL